ncbi:MAG: 30S ribosomal protein S20 [Clostridia bacterium]
MPNIKSAIKRVKVNEKKNLENRQVKSQLATATKKFKTALASNEKENATNCLSELVSLLDSAVAKNVIHLNYAARHKAHFSKLLSKLN